MVRDGMLTRYSCIEFLKSGYDDKIVCGEKRISMQNVKHFKMKMSEIDHRNSLDQDRAQQNVWQDPKEKGP